LFWRDLVSHKARTKDPNMREQIMTTNMGKPWLVVAFLCWLVLAAVVLLLQPRPTSAHSLALSAALLSGMEDEHAASSLLSTYESAQLAEAAAADSEEESAMAAARAVAHSMSDMNVDDVEPTSLVELSTSLDAESGASWRGGWRSRSRRFGRRFHSIRGARARAAQQAREDEQYRMNLANFEKRRAMKINMENVQSLLAKQESRLPIPDPAAASPSAMQSPEERAVMSLLEVTEQKPMTVQHTHNVRAKLTHDALHGTGLYNEANRRATAIGLANHPRNRPAPPPFAAPPLQQPQSQLAEVSFLTQREDARPAAAGPRMAPLPPENVPHPTVLQSRPPHSNAAAAHAAHSDPAQSFLQLSAKEKEFLEGMPPAFMELDGETQMHILALADKAMQHEKKQKQKQKAEKEQPSMNAQHSQPVLAEVSATTRATSASAVPPSSSAPLAASDVTSASRALNALADLHQATPVPIHKLVHMLAKGQE